MIPDLGKYADTVLAAYGLTGALLGAIVALSLVRSWRVGRDLERLERARRGKANV